MNIESIEVNQLQLDPQNPRLPVSINRSEESMLKYIAEKYSIEELMMSIGENGFFPGEPLIAVKNGNNYIVIEGNRRLTAVKLLNNPVLIDRGSIKKIVESACTPPPTSLPVVVFEKREKVIHYLGHRHITGVKAWSSFSKARYLSELYTSQLVTQDDKDLALRAVARVIGNRKDYVLRILGCLNVTRVIEEQNYFDFDNVGEHNFPFSVFYTAFQKAEIREYVDYPDFLTEDNLNLNINNLKNLTEWICVKRKGRGTVLGNPGNLVKLARILDNEEACSEIEQGASIEEAFIYTGSYYEEFSIGLHEIKRGLSKLNSKVAEIEYDDDLNAQIELILNQARVLKVSWNNKKVQEEDL